MFGWALSLFWQQWFVVFGKDCCFRDLFGGGKNDRCLTMFDYNTIGWLLMVKKKLNYLWAYRHSELLENSDKRRCIESITDTSYQNQVHRSRWATFYFFRIFLNEGAFVWGELTLALQKPKFPKYRIARYTLPFRGARQDYYAQALSRSMLSNDGNSKFPWILNFYEFLIACFALLAYDEFVSA